MVFTEDQTELVGQMGVCVCVCQCVYMHVCVCVFVYLSIFSWMAPILAVSQRVVLRNALM